MLLMYGDWSVRITHADREYMMIDDHKKKLTHMIDVNCAVFVQQPPDISQVGFDER